MNYENTEEKITLTNRFFNNKINFKMKSIDMWIFFLFSKFEEYFNW